MHCTLPWTYFSASKHWSELCKLEVSMLKTGPLYGQYDNEKGNEHTGKLNKITVVVVISCQTNMYFAYRSYTIQFWHFLCAEQHMGLVCNFPNQQRKSVLGCWKSRFPSIFHSVLCCPNFPLLLIGSSRASDLVHPWLYISLHALYSSLKMEAVCSPKTK
jgi:hypothetical protein